MKELLDSLEWEKAHYDAMGKGVFIPFRLIIGETNLRAFLHIPCSKEFFDGIVHGLKEEAKKNG